MLDALIPATLTVLVGACGAKHPNTTAASSETRTDTALAQRKLAEQLTTLHRALPGSWRQNGSANDALVCADNAIRAGRTGRAISQSIKYKRVEVRAGTYVFATSQSASRALPAFAAEAAQACRAEFLVAALRKHGYTTGSPKVHIATLSDIGQGANSTQITIPSRYKGRLLTWNIDETIVREGRLIELLDTLAGASTARYNQALAAEIAKITSAQQ